MTLKNRTKKSLTGFDLKVIAMISMIIDHAAASVLERVLYLDFPADLTTSTYNAWLKSHALGLLLNEVMRLAGRIAFPIFAFLLVEGVLHSSDIRKYLKGLFLFGLISEIPFDLAFYHEAVHTDKQNVMFTLFFGALMIAMIRRFTVERVPGENAAKVFIPAGAVMAACVSWVFSEITTFSWGSLPQKYAFFENLQFQWPMSAVAGVFAIAGGAVCLLLSGKLPAGKKSAAAYTMFISSLAIAVTKVLHTDYAGCGVLVILVMYLLRENKSLQSLAGWAVLTLKEITKYAGEAAAILALPFITNYNGQRGRKCKYFFYIFYPAHLLFLSLISHLLTM